MSDIITFTVKDREEKPHTYEMTLMPAGEGMQFTYELSAMLGGAVASLTEGEETISEALQPALSRLDPKRLSAITAQLLATVTRDGLPMHGHEFDKAYRGNYQEMLLATGRVIQENRFIPLLDGLIAQGQALWAEMQSERSQGESASE